MTQSKKVLHLEDLKTLPPNFKYAVSWNENLELTGVTVLEEVDIKTTYTSPTEGLPEAPIKALVNEILSSVKSGSMVMAFKDLDKTPTLSHALGQGLILYVKAPLAICNGVEEVVKVMYDTKMNFPDGGGLVVRHKRRQGKWYLHLGDFLPNVPADFYEKFDDLEGYRMYSLELRSHIAMGKEENDV